MASSPGKRSSRKTGSGTANSPTLLADPEAVAAVSRTVAKTVHTLVDGVAKTSRVLARACVTSAKWLAPRLAKLSVALGRGLWRALSSTARWTWTRRKLVTRVAHRGLWWGALAILILVGRALLAADGDPELVEVALLWFGAGLSMSILVLVGAPEKRMRVAAFALASGHGSLAALAWVAAVGV